MNAIIAQSVSEVVVSGDEHQRLRAALADLRAEYSRADDPRFLHRSASLGSVLPANVRQALRETRYLESAAALVVRSSPVGDRDPGPTPAHWRERRADATVDQDLWLALIATHLGDPICWSSLQDGRLFNDILPIRGQEDQQTGHGSAAELEFHVEDAFHDDRCDALALLCLREEGGALSTIASTACLDLTALDLEALFEPRFEIFPDPEHLRTGTIGHAVRRPLLFGVRESPYLRVDPAYTQPAAGDVAARRAFEGLCEQLAAGLVDVALRPGDVLVVDNYRAVHGRRPFRARYDGTDRWLRKLTVVRDLRSRQARRDGVDGRVLAPF